ncbi:Uncharacterised protein [Mycobacteroides abscessus subsp. massiliense]|uniref:hypothetical protein n=1 Tax=Mycobacteroides abscessus TaxID=36809 RepID=UPI00037CC038|nr:hypothetical protein [Mycobacteroides abscessus]SKD60951.1 Uncharacterised protein [Mycobacteroides abscessus subsp. massiliense]SKH40697.1 Uncharacterised protein [Mycobacteroides abscessus subsp. massiliense]SKH90398.1 Uncharacterised protein [Mycobacteroides abscessus subsp. massiliense]SKK83728.1 Uncharacterised protein [Mycobacteroides abscessus subsp. massiliense]SKK90171.1 Uncharacterised protein [Mycobacteroides abscessus subsp. massiliense]
MTDIDDDPFAPKTAVADNPVSSDAGRPPAVVKTAAVGDGEGKIVLTYKEGAGFDSSWTVVHASSVEDAKAILKDPEFKELLDLSKKAAAYFRGGSTPAAAPPAQARSNAPAAAQSAPGGDTRQCKHGEMQYKTGSKNGRTWKGFFCPTPKDTPDQCSPEFLR